MSHTLRTARMQAKYEKCLREDKGKDLRDEELVKEFEHFKIVVNRFPHDRIAKVHHMLVPKRKITSTLGMRYIEKVEFETEVDDYCSKNYDCIKRNYPSMTSVVGLLHWHLMVYK